MSDVFDGDEVERDKISKQLKVVTETTKLVSTSTIPDLVALHDALSSGETLTATVLTGGLTNYSYKVHVTNNDNDSVKPIFVKLSFPYALWSSDKNLHYDLQRTKNEFDMMQLFAGLAPGHVATPFLCHSIPADASNPYEMLMLVTEWCTSDEQLANQWLDGVVDDRIAEPFGRAVAKLHMQPFEEGYNQAVNKTVADCIWPASEDKFTELLAQDDGENERYGLLAREFGPEKLFGLLARLKASFETKEVFAHSDLHSFNILVEKKPDASELVSFGPTGNFMLCDWEMTSGCPVGRDFGTFSAFPVLCILTNARLGHAAAALELRSTLHRFVDAYLAALAEEGKDEEYINAAYRNIIAFTGYFTHIYVALGVHYDCLPLDSSSSELSVVLESLGVLSLRFLELGLDGPSEGLSRSSLRSKFDSLLDVEVASLSAVSTRRRGRRGSVLRESGTVISDSGRYVKKNFGEKVFEGQKNFGEKVKGAFESIGTTIKKGGAGVASSFKSAGV
ncbi:hypothetical protein TrVE_jg7352 [Triparma verrucosa]|uniref:Aminoglycoside phosphotransferase domain-containing protein n=1 Tax=Triparma verrucosa TaxID=1606542 RepID=A0A9W7BC89_9STRA|nr:hypothetical protein TrVE_jg7352 [Triparma verrucosa]